MFEFIITFIRSLFGAKPQRHPKWEWALVVVRAELIRKDGNVFQKVEVFDGLTYEAAQYQSFNDEDLFSDEVTLVKVNEDRIDVDIDLEEFCMIRVDEEWLDRCTFEAPIFSMVH
jgi:hypothetical protein